MLYESGAHDQPNRTPLLSTIWVHLSALKFEPRTAALDLCAASQADAAACCVCLCCRWTPLHWAAVWNKLEVAKVLLANGAQVNADNNGGETALAVARYNHSREMEALLWQHGAEEDEEDDDEEDEEDDDEE